MMLLIIINLGVDFIKKPPQKGVFYFLSHFRVNLRVMNSLRTVFMGKLQSYNCSPATY